MNQAASKNNNAGRFKVLLRQSIKWLVYSLLLVNFGLYFIEELEFARHTLRAGGTILDWTKAFATTADEFAWFGLLFLFELETYALSDEVLKPWLQRSLHVLRLVCYVFLAHTIYAWGDEVYNVQNLQPDQEFTSVCQMADLDISFTRNFKYTLIDGKNCSTLGSGPVFYKLEKTVYTDVSGLTTTKRLAWVDLIEAAAWLLIVFTIELAIWLQARNITGGRLMMVSYSGKALYAVLFGAAIFWAYKGHWLYTWDELLWIGGFFAIELNMKLWREEIAVEEKLAGY